MSHAVRLPLLPKHDTVSQPVKVWNIGKVTHRSRPSALAILWAGKYRKFFQAPNAIHSSVILRHWADVTARTTTSVSTVWMGILSCPCFTASSRWSRIRVSASSCVHGARPYMSRGHISVICADDLFVSDNGCCTSCQKWKTYPVVNAEKCGGGYISLSLFVLQPSSYLWDVYPIQLVCSHAAVVMWCDAGTLGS